jgi:hypothetical protein
MNTRQKDRSSDRVLTLKQVYAVCWCGSQTISVAGDEGTWLRFQEQYAISHPHLLLSQRGQSVLLEAQALHGPKLSIVLNNSKLKKEFSVLA